MWQQKDEIGMLWYGKHSFQTTQGLGEHLYIRKEQAYPTLSFLRFSLYEYSIYQGPDSLVWIEDLLTQSVAQGLRLVCSNVSSSFHKRVSR